MSVPVMMIWSLMGAFSLYLGKEYFFFYETVQTDKR